MRTAAIVIGSFALCGCARHENQAAASAAKPAASAAATTAAPAAKPSPISNAWPPSYEVTIASAQADRVRALNGCDAKQGGPRAACVRAADSSYDDARQAAQKIREN